MQHAKSKINIPAYCCAYGMDYGIAASIVRLDTLIVRPLQRQPLACSKSASNAAISASKPSNVIGVYGVFAPKKTIGKQSPFINVAMISCICFVG
jgi:hypothetical protein